MTETQSSESLSEEPQASVTAPEAESEPPEPLPEPWTPARVVEWNAYYDLYVAIGVLLLAFATSANEITHSPLWPALQAGRAMIAQASPLVSDLFSYTETGRRWVNVSWLFEWSHALLFDAVKSAAPVNPADPLSSEVKHEQLAAAALVAVTALVRVATVLILLFIRREGPGLWWSAVVAAVAFGAFIGPTGPALGGIAGTAVVTPDVWGTFLLALELYVWHRATDRGQRGAAWALVPLFLVWANIDDSFLIGLIVLAAGVLGRFGAGADNPLRGTRGLAILAACAGVCLVNPSFYRIFPAAFSSFSTPFRLSPLFPGNVPVALERVARLIAIIYFVCAALGFGSFALNRRRFSLSRFLIYFAAVLLWGAYLHDRAEFAVVFTATLALNGQEWYHDRFGTAGRVENRWGAWSVGGRAITIVAVFTFVGMALTGWGKAIGDPVFGFGYNAEAFAFEMAQFLQSAKIEGRVLNTTREQGDAIVWRAYPKRLTFIDSRSHLFPAALVRRLQETRVALSTDDVAGWKPLFDEFGISAVIIDEPSSPKTYQRLLQSPNWIPFYDDGTVVLFGRSDAPAADLAFFRSHRLHAGTLAYSQQRDVPPPDSTPMPTTWVDRIWRNRSLHEPQPHTTASLHWLQTQGSEDTSETGRLPDPAHCLMAIQEARVAIAHRADDTGPYRILSEAYRLLMLHESALLSGLKLSPENADAIIQGEPRTNLLVNRFRQRVMALNAAIQTTTVPRNEAERQGLFALNYQLYQLYMGVNYLDLARERLQAMLAYAPEKLNPEMHSGLSQQFEGLSRQVKTIQDEVNDRTVQDQLDSMNRAAVARSMGAPGLALVDLEEAERTGLNPAQVRPQLIDLYCDTGQVDKAQELINNGLLEDGSQDTEPGATAARQARVNFLLGFYEAAARLWEDRAIFKVRYDRSLRALIGATSLLRGQVKSSTTLLLDLPGKVGLQASWEYDLGMCLLEAGKPALAAEPLTRALTLAPDLPQRRVAAYYLEKLGKPVPPPSAEPETKASEPAEKKPAAEEKPASRNESPADAKDR